MRRPIAVLASTAASALLAAAPAHAVSQWPQFRGNSQGTGQSTATGPTRAAAVRGFPFKAAGTVASPVVSNNGTVVFGAGAYLYAVSPSGRQIWRYYGGQSTTFGMAPAVTGGGTVYAVSSQAIPGAVFSETNLIALTPQGQLKWSEEVGFSTSPPTPVNVTLGPDGTIYTTGPDNPDTAAGACRRSTPRGTSSGPPSSPASPAPRSSTPTRGTSMSPGRSPQGSPAASPGRGAVSPPSSPGAPSCGRARPAARSVPPWGPTVRCTRRGRASPRSLRRACCWATPRSARRARRGPRR